MITPMINNGKKEAINIAPHSKTQAPNRTPREISNVSPEFFWFKQGGDLMAAFPIQDVFSNLAFIAKKIPTDTSAFIGFFKIIGDLSGARSAGEFKGALAELWAIAGQNPKNIKVLGKKIQAAQGGGGEIDAILEDNEGTTWVEETKASKNKMSEALEPTDETEKLVEKDQISHLEHQLDRGIAEAEAEGKKPKIRINMPDDEYERLHPKYLFA